MGKNKMFTKSGEVTSLLAKRFIAIDINNRINTVTELSEELNASRGTIQNSLKFLSDNSAIKLESRGHLGTFLSKKNQEKLIEISGINLIIGAMPLPYSKRYEGLSTAIINSIENNASIPINMAYMRGSKNRLNMVLNGRYDFAITSKYAALEFIKNNDELEIVKELPPYSFLSKHVIMYNDPKFSKIENGMTAGLDKDSVDQENLTLIECKGKEINFMYTSYNQLIENLVSGKIDFAIWNGDELINKGNEILTKDLNVNDILATIAVIVTNKNRVDLKKIIQDNIDINYISNIQNDVINNVIIPRY